MITAAAAIMICVFRRSCWAKAASSRSSGLSLAVGRASTPSSWLPLLPSVLDIIGNATWSIPAWLDRLPPTLNIEGGGTRLSPADEAEFAAFAAEQPAAGTPGGTEG